MKITNIHSAKQHPTSFNYAFVGLQQKYPGKLETALVPPTFDIHPSLRADEDQNGQEGPRTSVNIIVIIIIIKHQIIDLCFSTSVTIYLTLDFESTWVCP